MTPSESLSHPGAAAPADPAGDDRLGLRIVIAPNAFKGSLTASAAAGAMTSGALGCLPHAEIDVVPVADGGDGSIDAFVSAGFTRHPVTTRGPTGHPLHASYAVRDDVAVVELADACGMTRLPEGRLAPMDSSTLGLGDALTAALDRGPRQIVVCLGGSASTDGGSGMLVALGARLLDADGDELAPSGAALGRIAAIDVTGLDPRLTGVHLVVAVDVDSPLTGERGAAVVFAPQKGATPAQVAVLDAALEHWAVLLAETFGRAVAKIPGAGAAGGTAAALLALDAELRPGFDEIARLVRLTERIARADLVITGEGRLDEQSSLGKGVGGVVQLCRSADVPVLAVCGEVAVPAETLHTWGVTGAAELRSIAADDADARANAGALLTQATASAVASWLGR